MEIKTEFRNIWLRSYLILGVWLGFLVVLAWSRTSLFLQETTYEFEFFSNSSLEMIWKLLGIGLLIYLAYTWFVHLKKSNERNPIVYYWLLAPFLSLYLLSPSIYTFAEHQKRKYLFPEEEAAIFHEKIMLALPFLMLEEKSYHYSKRAFPEVYQDYLYVQTDKLPPFINCNEMSDCGPIKTLNKRRDEPSATTNGLNHYIIKINPNDAAENYYQVLTLEDLKDFEFEHIKNFAYTIPEYTNTGEFLYPEQPQLYLQRIHNWLDKHPDSIQTALRNLKNDLQRWEVPNRYEPDYVWDYLRKTNFKPRHNLTTDDEYANIWAERIDFDLWMGLDTNLTVTSSHFDDEIRKQYISFPHINWLFNIHEQHYYSEWLENELIFMLLAIVFVVVQIVLYNYNLERPKSFVAIPLVVGFVLAINLVLLFLSEVIGFYFSDAAFFTLNGIIILASIVSGFFRLPEALSNISDSVLFFLGPFVPILLSYSLLEKYGSQQILDTSVINLILISPYFVFPLILMLRERKRVQAAQKRESR